MKSPVVVNVHSRIRNAQIFQKEMEQILLNFKNFYKIKVPVIVDVSIVGETKIKTLNSEYRGKNYVTDILSFSFDTYQGINDLPILLLGELIICWKKVEKQAKEFGHSVKREFCYLFTHGLVHLQGYDHEIEEERIAMNQMVDAIFNPLNITREDHNDRI